MKRLPSLLIILTLLTGCSAVPSAAPEAETLAFAEAPAATATTLPSFTPLPAPEIASAAMTATPEPTAATEAADSSATPDATAETTAAASPESAVTDPGSDLSGVAWQWGGGRSASGCDVLILQPDGGLQVLSECQGYAGSYTREAAGLSLTLPEDARGQMVGALRGVSAWEISNGQLALQKPGTTVTLTAYPLLSAALDGTEGAQATLTMPAALYLGPDKGTPQIGVLPAGSQVRVVRQIYKRAFWGVSMPGLPDGLAWIPRQAAELTDPAAVEYTQPELLQVGGNKLIWPDTDQPRASLKGESLVYAGPGNAYVPVMAVMPGDTFYALGRSVSGDYTVIYVPGNVVPGGLAWLPAAQAELRNTADLPVFPPPPAPGQTRFQLPGAGQGYVVPLTTVNIRGGPGVEYTVYGTADRGEIYLATGLTPDGLWYRIKVPASLSSDQIAWISAPNVRAINDSGVAKVEYPFPMPLLRPDTLGPLCRIVAQSPREMSILPLGYTFTYRVELLNDTGVTWSRGDIDFVYIDSIDNAPMHTGPMRLDLEEHVANGRTAVVEFESLTPTKHPGVFGERWVVRKAGETVCAFTYQYRVR